MGTTVAFYGKVIDGEGLPLTSIGNGCAVPVLGPSRHVERGFGWRRRRSNLSDRSR